MTNLRYEAWPIPGTPSYDVVVRDLQAVSGSGTLPKTPIGNGAVEIPRGALRIDGTSVLDAVVLTDPTTPANDVTSVIRVYRAGDAETTPIHEWLVEDPVAESDDAGTVRLAGRNIEAILDYEHVEVFDWDGSPVFLTRFPDHIYGGKNILQNPGLETGPVVNDVYDVRHDHTGGTFRLRPDTTFTANMAFGVSAGVMETEIETALTTDGFTNPDARVTVATPPSGFTEAWRVEIVVPNQFLGMIGDGALLTGGATLVVDNIQAGGRSTGQWSKSTDLSRGVLTEHGTYAAGTAGFRLSTGAEPVLSGSFSLRVNGLTQFAGAQQLVRVKPGGTYQLVMPLFTSSGVDIFRSVIRTVDEQFIASSSPFSGVISGSVGAWDSTTFSITNVVIPDGVDRVVVRFAYVGTGNPAPFLLDEMEFNEGLAATSPGNILIDLFDDAQTDHAPTRAALTFINLDFTGAVDSDGAAWTDTTLSLTIKRRQSYHQMMMQFLKLGYEWRLTPTVATPGEWDLQVYNNGTLGVDFGGLDDPAIVIGQGTLPSAVTRQRPIANYLMAEGAGGLTARTSSAASITAVGRRAQGIFDRRFTDSADVSTWVVRRLAMFLTETLAPRIVIQEPNVSDDWPRPMDEYSPGDTVDFILADGATRIERRIESVSYQDTGQDGLRWTVEGGSAAPFVAASSGGGVPGNRSLSFGEGESSHSLGTASGSQMKVMGVAVRAILEEFRFDEDQEVAPLSITPAAGGVPTVFVVASNATDKEKGMADYQCSGVSDQGKIHEARDFLDGIGGGRLVFSFGDFNCDEVGIVVDTPILDLFGDIVYQGMGNGDSFGTYINIDASTKTASAAGFAGVDIGTSGASTVRDITFTYVHGDVGDGDPIYEYAYRIWGSAGIYNTRFTGTGNKLLSVVVLDDGIENILDGVRIQGSTDAILGPDNCLRIRGGGTYHMLSNIHLEDCRQHSLLIKADEIGHTIVNVIIQDVGAATANTYDGIHIEDGTNPGLTRQIGIANVVVDSVQHRSALYIAGLFTTVAYTNIGSVGHDTAVIIDLGRPGGGQQRAVEVAAATTILPYSAIYNVDTSGGTVAMTMPDNAEAQGAVIIVVRDGPNDVTLVRAGADTFSDGSTTLTLDTDNTAVQNISIGDGEWKTLTPSTGGGVTDHGALTGLSDIADHAYAVLIDGTRNITGNQRFTVGLVLSNAQQLQLEGSTAGSLWDWRTLGDSLSLRFNSIASGEDERLLIEIDGDWFFKDDTGSVFWEYRHSLSPKRFTLNQILAMGINGNAGAPAIVSVNDFDSGIFFGTDILGFAAGGIEFFRLTEGVTDTIDVSVDVDMQTNSLLNALNLTDGGNADALHTHAGGASAEDSIPNILMLGGM